MGTVVISFLMSTYSNVCIPPNYRYWGGHGGDLLPLVHCIPPNYRGGGGHSGTVSEVVGTPSVAQMQSNSGDKVTMDLNPGPPPQ